MIEQWKRARSKRAEEDTRGRGTAPAKSLREGWPWQGHNTKERSVRLQHGRQDGQRDRVQWRGRKGPDSLSDLVGQGQGTCTSFELQGHAHARLKQDC